jgi:hypothetical protein
MVGGMKLRRSVPLLLTALTAGVAGFSAGRMFPVAAETPGPGKEAKAVPLAARESGRTTNEPAAGKGLARAMSPQSARVLARLEEMLPVNDSQWLMMQEMGQWLAECPSDVLGFLELSPRRDELLHRAASIWGERDARGISEWLAAAGDFEGRDAIVSGMAEQVARDDGDAAIAWIASIKDPQQKLIAAQGAGYSFYRHSDEATREAFQKMGLPDSAFDSIVDEGVRGRYQAYQSRNAQNLASVHQAARAAGAEFAPQSAAELLEGLSKGISGAGQFSGSLFKVDTTNWTAREIEDTLKLLEVSDGKVKYKPEQPKAP